MIAAFEQTPAKRISQLKLEDLPSYGYGMNSYI